MKRLNWPLVLKAFLITMLGVAIMATDIATPISFHTAYAAPGVTAEELDRYLRDKGSPMAEQGQALVESGRQWNVDPRLVVAIAGAESTFGTRVCAEYNAWNWFYKDTTNCSANAFSSWNEGIERVMRGLRQLYLDRGRTTIPKIAEIYTTTERDIWISNVTLFYQTELGGDVSDLSYAPLSNLSSEVIHRAESEAPIFRPYEYGIHDCWLYVKHVWRPWKDLNIYNGGGA